jgi:hypothetical protein
MGRLPANHAVAKGPCLPPVPIFRPRAGLAALAAALLALAWTTPARAQSVPRLAVEDTMHTELPEEIVRAPRVSLDEILRRVAEGEARRDSLMQDQEFVLLAALTYVDESKSGAAATVRQWESASKVYRKRPDKVRTIKLREKSNFKSDDGANVSADAGMGEELVNFAFQPRTRSRFEFRILERHLVGDHVVYLISFTPKSKLDQLPTGRAWVDMNEFVIVRQEFWYRDRSPAPLVFERIESCVIERAHVDGKWWVMSRVLARVRLTSLARFLARVGKQKLTPVVDFSLAQRDWKINRGIDDSIFAAGTR